MWLYEHTEAMLALAPDRIKQEVIQAGEFAIETCQDAGEALHLDPPSYPAVLLDIMNGLVVRDCVLLGSDYLFTGRQRDNFHDQSLAAQILYEDEALHTELRSRRLLVYNSFVFAGEGLVSIHGALCTGDTKWLEGDLLRSHRQSFIDFTSLVVRPMLELSDVYEYNPDADITFDDWNP